VTHITHLIDQSNELCWDNGENVVVVVDVNVEVNVLEQVISGACSQPICPYGQTWSDSDQSCHFPCFPEGPVDTCKERGWTPICASSPQEYCNYGRSWHLDHINPLCIPARNATMMLIEVPTLQTRPTPSARTMVSTPSSASSRRCPPNRRSSLSFRPSSLLSRLRSASSGWAVSETPPPARLHPTAGAHCAAATLRPRRAASQASSAVFWATLRVPSVGFLTQSCRSAEGNAGKITSRQNMWGCWHLWLKTPLCKRSTGLAAGPLEGSLTRQLEWLGHAGQLSCRTAEQRCSTQLSFCAHSYLRDRKSRCNPSRGLLTDADHVHP
jgi:hypothetical protein